MKGCFFFSCIWALGSTIEVSYREGFSKIFRALLEREFFETVKKEYSLPDEIEDPKKPYITIIPNEGSVYDYKYVKQGKGIWTLWSDDLENDPPIPNDIPVNQIIVSTVETIRYFHLFKMLVTHNKPVLLVGPTGTGKSAYISEFLLKKNNPKVYRPLSITFSAQTTANQTQNIIMSKMDKRRKGIYGPPPGKKYCSFDVTSPKFITVVRNLHSMLINSILLGMHWVIFIDDVSMPTKEEYGAQPPIELLRQWLDHDSFYDLKDMSLIHLTDVQPICAMLPPSSGKDVTPRFKRHFFTMSISEFDEDVMTTIFTKIVGWHFRSQKFPEIFSSYVNYIVWATLDIYKDTLKYLLPTPAKSHYTFNLRDFSRVIQGVLLSRPQSTPDLVFFSFKIYQSFRNFSNFFQ